MTLYDDLVSFGLKPEVEFEFNQPTDSLMRVRASGVRKLVDNRWNVNRRKLHVSLIPNDVGIVETALISAAADNRRPGFWHVILDSTGRPVAEHPLKYTMRPVNPSPLAVEHPIPVHQPPSANQAVFTVETTGDLMRQIVSWLIGYDRVNDDDIAAILEELSKHSESPRAVTIGFKTLQQAQRMTAELLCFIDDATGLDDAIEQATALREKISSRLKEFPV